MRGGTSGDVSLCLCVFHVSLCLCERISVFSQPRLRVVAKNSAGSLVLALNHVRAESDVKVSFGFPLNMCTLSLWNLGCSN